jgi:hypothetical protein
MKTLQGVSITEVVEGTYTIAEVEAWAAAEVVLSLEIAPFTIVTSVFIHNDDLEDSTGLTFDIGHLAYTDLEGTVVALDIDAWTGTPHSGQAAGDLTVATPIIPVGINATTGAGTTIELTCSVIAAGNGLAGDIKFGYTGVAVPRR